MAGQRTARRILMSIATLLLVVSVVGFIATLILNAFVLDKYDAYGEVPVPGSSTLHLPAGEVTVSFHTQVTGSPSGGFPVPQLDFSLVPPAGVPEPQATENIGSTTSVNNDVHVRVWTVQITKEGDYGVRTDGQVNGYIDPALAFGHSSSYGWLIWLFVGLFVVGLVGVVATLLVSARSGKRARPLSPEELLPVDRPTWNAGPPPAPVPGIAPRDEGARLEQLRSLAALRDSGALTEDEFQAEKRRILDN
jgi:hypothetical protein